MKAKLEFNLPEEQSEFECAAHAMDWYLAVSDIADELRNRLKFGDAGKEIEEFRTWVWEMLNDRGLDPYRE